MVGPAVNRELIGLALAAVALAGSTPALAKDDPRPSLSIDPVVARSLLSPVDEARGMPGYRFDPGFDPATGGRARLSLEVGSASVFAITGRLSRPPQAVGPLDSGHAKILGPRRDSGKVYGGGVSGRVQGVDLSATYQYSKINPGELERDSEAGDDGPGRSHSLRATARIRFRP